MPGRADATVGHDASPPRDHESPKHPLPSHCDGGICQCACLHVAQATGALPRVPALAIGAAAMPSPAIHAHAEPALPHLIRPPIG